MHIVVTVKWQTPLMTDSMTVSPGSLSTRSQHAMFPHVSPDVNDFISQSGWFSYPGLPHSKEALHRVLAKKCKMSHREFMAHEAAVYKLDYTHGEKVRKNFSLLPASL